MRSYQADPFADTQRFDVISADTQKIMRSDIVFDVGDQAWFDQADDCAADEVAVAHPCARARLACAVAAFAALCAAFVFVI